MTVRRCFHQTASRSHPTPVILRRVHWLEPEDLKLKNQLLRVWPHKDRGPDASSFHRDEEPDVGNGRRGKQIAIKKDGDRMVVRREQQPPIPDDLMTIIKEGA